MFLRSWIAGAEYDGSVGEDFHNSTAVEHRFNSLITIMVVILTHLTFRSSIT